ncbi:hypothetical protein BJD99_10525 [Rhodococcus sp. 1163]|uniref:hypothetical protein n=1 Tax=Rhodococcus sp. 1163 TaxID=1905289 RepID=UPI000A01EAFA|nr:hypothetical protein [Rhodococcus sp. 1163]ORI16919.1 hypothetical protein BJD99_10525 [Rhodococcus sp. 1163]
MNRDAEIGRWLVAERDELIDELERDGLDAVRVIDDLRGQIVDAAIERELDTAGIKRTDVSDLLAAVDRSKFLSGDGTVDVARVRAAIGALARSVTAERRPPPRSSDSAQNRGVGRYREQGARG